MKSSELEFDLPRDLIATTPADPRDAARLMVVRKSTDEIEHRRVRDLPEILDAGDLLVLNRTRVAPALFVGRNTETGGKVEGLWLRDEPSDGSGDSDDVIWAAMIKSRRHKPGYRVRLDARQDAVIEIELLERVGTDDEAEAGAWRVRVEGPTGMTSSDWLGLVGKPPLPPYIRSARKERGELLDSDADVERYQTIFAQGETLSVAAPTAGLHFTPELFERLASVGIDRTEVTLHVGAGTFKTIETEEVEAHPMHREWCSIAPEAADQIFGSDRRVIAVGSTSTRTIESYAAAIGEGGAPPPHLETDLMISEGYQWRRVAGLLTNFHLPRSTLLAMVAGALPGGIGRVRELYEIAVAERYRFFSFGDAMLILP
ncbi:MAG: tRNA preQ1(34) S-adenosylmethionine ribosyltransferase-isomerase QueA [Planctomycetota bacterium]